MSGMGPPIADFDDYCDQHQIADEELPAAFAAWINSRTGWDGPMREVGGGDD